MTWNQKILNSMSPFYWYKPYSLTPVYFDAPRRLRSMWKQGLVAKKPDGKFMLYKKLV